MAADDKVKINIGSGVPSMTVTQAQYDEAAAKVTPNSQRPKNQQLSKQSYKAMVAYQIRKTGGAAVSANGGITNKKALKISQEYLKAKADAKHSAFAKKFVIGTALAFAGVAALSAAAGAGTVATSGATKAAVTTAVKAGASTATKAALAGGVATNAAGQAVGTYAAGTAAVNGATVASQASLLGKATATIKAIAKNPVVKALRTANTIRSAADSISTITSPKAATAAPAAKQVANIAPVAEATTETDAQKKAQARVSLNAGAGLAATTPLGKSNVTVAKRKLLGS